MQAHRAVHLGFRPQQRDLVDPGVEQVAENVKASGVEIPAELMARIDEVLGDSVVTDPAETAKSSPASR